MIDYIEKAKAFAMMAHKGQTDKAGEDYFTAHVAVVADGVEPDPLVKTAAYLHDTVEDTGTTIDTIRAEFPQEVAEAVSVLTREKDMTYAEYIWRVKQNDIAVKLTPPTIEIVGFPGGGGKAYHHAAYKAASYAVSHHPLRV